ncbi:MAG: anthranilate phosphoribosyltransferase [Betaproteobacteria bacterium RBG_16_56_24]|nr:MAG: anthranilate phosphoribosyltransferase [Betaproteobacteria bacterium RBG_16_56_24]
MNYSQTLTKLIDRHDLPFAEMRELMQHIMGGQLTPAQIAAVLIALRMKSETVNEIAAAAEVMRELSTKVSVKNTKHLIDTCGTGGDSMQTFNISTASAFVAAAAGAHVAKHGGRSVSSTCGSADVLEKLGVNVSLTPDQVAQCVDGIGIGFMFAPNHHSAMKHAAPVRRELGVRTLFNLLGPLTNPAGAQNQVIGVFHQSLTVKLAQVLASLGSRHVLVVHGADGMDEISISEGTYIAELKDGKVGEYTVHPDLFGLPSAPIGMLRVANADEACEKLLGVLNNEVGVPRDIVQLNAGAAIYVAGLVNTLEEGVAKADEIIASGAARTKLDQLIALSNSISPSNGK